MSGPGPYPLPEDPALAAVAQAMEQTGVTGEVWDADWRLAYATDDYRLSAGGGAERAEVQIGVHKLSAQWTELQLAWRGGPTLEAMRASLEQAGPYLLADTPGGRDELRGLADPRFHDIIDRLEPREPPAAWSDHTTLRYGTGSISFDAVVCRIRDGDGQVRGSVVVGKPAVPGAVLGMLALGDLGLFRRMLEITRPARRPAAILFADLEGSTPLSRRLPTPAYFALLRRLTFRIDECVVGAGGIVGKHVGDGVTAFFLTGEGRDESGAARACIAAAREIRVAAAEAAKRSDLDPEAISIRFGLHWGATLYVGRLMTAGRAEVTALGDEVNEAARIEACATGGRALASKPLIERLDPEAARDLGIDPARLRYTPLGDLPTASEKARRDAPALAVCEV